ncbi:hypothetical protein BaRGS_00000564, partial [Batillaria attramentaria]
MAMCKVCKFAATKKFLCRLQHLLNFTTHSATSLPTANPGFVDKLEMDINTLLSYAHIMRRNTSRALQCRSRPLHKRRQLHDCCFKTFFAGSFPPLTCQSVGAGGRRDGQGGHTTTATGQ